MKLPKLEIQKFYGNPKGSTSFKGAFDANVNHQLESIFALFGKLLDGGSQGCQ